MRARWVLACLWTACGGGATSSPAGPDAAVAAAASDAAPAAAAPDAAAEDLDMTLADFGAAQGQLVASGRGYGVANLLGHEAAALAAAAAPSGAAFPGGSVVESNPSEVMVKRRAGWNPATNDWEFFRIGLDGATPVSIELRGAEETACFMCHAKVSSPTWDFICNHP